MYNEHFGLRERPFKSVPDPDFFYLGTREREVLDRVKVFMDDPSVSLFVLTGEVGAGKTLLLKVLGKDVPDTYRIVSLTYSGDEPVYYLRALCSELGGRPDGIKDVSTGKETVEQILAQDTWKGLHLLLCLDEAQNLPFKSMAELLTSLEHPRVKVVLAGLFGLRGNARLASRGLVRMEAYDSCHLGPITEEECPAYISHRVSLSGGELSHLFVQNALPEVLKVSKGIPRLINKICDLALLNAYFVEKKQVTLGIVKDVATDILESREEIPDLAPFPSLPKPGATELCASPDSLSAAVPPPSGAQVSGEPGLPDEGLNLVVAGIEARRKVRATLDSLWEMGLGAKDIFDLFADAMKEHQDGAPGTRAPRTGNEPSSMALRPRLAVLLHEKNPRMRMHLENRCAELEFNPVVVQAFDELAQTIAESPASDLQILVADFDAFSGPIPGAEAALNQLGAIRYNFPHLPVIVTSVLPLLAIRSRLLYLDMPYLLHKPDMTRINLSEVRREFGSFFYELYRCISSIHSHTEAVILKAYTEALGLGRSAVPIHVKPGTRPEV